MRWRGALIGFLVTSVTGFAYLYVRTVRGDTSGLDLPTVVALCLGIGLVIGLFGAVIGALVDHSTSRQPAKRPGPRRVSKDR